jgi:hypothetical protein
MRVRRLLSLCGVLLVLAVTLGVPTKALGDPFCLFVDEQCVSCGRGCGKLCDYYECDDGTQRVFCGSCNCIEGCVVS